MKFVDVQGRVDKFMAKVKHAQVTQTQTQKKAAKKKAAEAKSYQQILREQKATLQGAKQTTPASQN